MLALTVFIVVFFGVFIILYAISIQDERHMNNYRKNFYRWQAMSKEEQLATGQTTWEC